MRYMSNESKLPVDYALRRSRRKTLAVHVRNQQVEVRAPLFVAAGEIHGFLLKHLDWIQGKLREQARQADEALAIRDGGPIFYKARECHLLFQQQSRPGVWLRGRELCIGGPDLLPARAERIFRDWLMAEAKAYLPRRTEALVRHLGLESRFREVVFRKTRSKWGHCTAEGRIQYNWLIMLAPDAVVDYMITHEVCHRIHMNHSRYFWQEVARLCPEHRRYRRWLQDHAHRLWF